VFHSNHNLSLPFLAVSCPLTFLSFAAMTGVAVVTGANKGIGFFIAKQLLDSGRYGRVVIACRNKELGAKAVSELGAGAGTYNTSHSRARVTKHTSHTVHHTRVHAARLEQRDIYQRLR
jgi:NAD(P)-dependent dehydrogenase (short-subunit alcohol dehydrogenase family)